MLIYMLMLILKHPYLQHSNILNTLHLRLNIFTCNSFYFGGKQQEDLLMSVKIGLQMLLITNVARYVNVKINHYSKGC